MHWFYLAVMRDCFVATTSCPMEYELGKCLPTYWLVEMICELLNIQSVKKQGINIL